MLKKIIPPLLRLKLRIFFIWAKDVFTFRYFSFVKKSSLIVQFPRQLSMSQPIRRNEFSENKKHNLRLAIQHLEKLQISPDQIFSYWHLIPQPIPKNGFKKGRNLLGNELALDFGGGLCQLSGIVYHLSLETGLEIMERHPHSLDIYTEASRYTPLGSDATVVFGHKDLRIRNNLGVPFCFEFEVLDEEIWIHLCAEQPIKKCPVDFLVKESKDGKMVEVVRIAKEIKEICSKDFYKNLK